MNKLTCVAFKKLTERDIQLPSYATDGAAGMDICACLDAPVTLAPMQRALIPTGLAISVPENTAAMLYPRSGLAVKHGITLSNCVGVIDSDYRGEIKIGIINQSDKVFTINDGDRIAQIVITPIIKAKPFFTDLLDETARGSGGFGSTGISQN